MKPRQALLLIAFLLCLGLLSVVLGQRTISQAREEARAAEAYLHRVLKVAERSAEPGTVTSADKVDPASAARSACLAAGITPSALASVQPRGERPARGDQPAAASVDVVLRGVTPEQWAQWLNAFAEAAGDWTPVHLHAQHHSDSSGDLQAYDLHLTCERPLWAKR